MSTLSIRELRTRSLILPTEVILSILLESFYFKPAEKPAVWNYSNIAFPTIDPNSPKVALPVKIEAIRPGSL